MKTCSSIELLEPRIAPANILVVVSGHLLVIAGDNDANSVLIKGDAGDATKFVVTSASDTINGGSGATGFTSPIGITDISIRLFEGADTVTLDSAVPIHLRGGLKIDGGDGANTVTGTGFTVDKQVAITNGDAGEGTQTTTFINLNVGGALTINNKAGNTSTIIQRIGAGFSLIGGDVRITNGAGLDFNVIIDINLGKNVTIKNGAGDGAGVAGTTRIFNEYNAAFQSVIGGNVLISYLDGNSSLRDGIWDTHVLGNVTINHGKGTFLTFIDGYRTNTEVVIDGNLTLKGTGPNTINLGEGWANTGLIVGKKLTITSGSGVDTLNFNEARIIGKTALALGDGANIVQIDDSLFTGTFGLTTGKDADTVGIESATGTSRNTVFARAVLIKQGEGGNNITLAGGIDAGQRLGIYSTFVIHRGTGTSFKTETPANEYFPFGNSVVWVV